MSTREDLLQPLGPNGREWIVFKQHSSRHDILFFSLPVLDCFLSCPLLDPSFLVPVREQLSLCLTGFRIRLEVAIGHACRPNQTK